MSNTTENTIDIDLIDSNTVTDYTFLIEREGVKYHVKVYVNESGKFIDDSITYVNSGEELEYQGEEGDVREELLNQLDKDWYKIVG